MSSSQNIKCGWSDCHQKFGTEIDMNMHVMMNHMVILDHGTFTLNRHNVTRRRVVREPSVELIEQPSSPTPARPVHVQVKQEPIPTPPNIINIKPQTVPEFRVPEPPVKIPRVDPPTKPFAALENMIQRFVPPPMSIPQDLDIPDRSPWVPPNPQNIPSTSGGVQQEEDEEVNEDSMHGSEQGQMDMQEQVDMMEAVIPKLSDIIDDFITRLRPMKQLGFRRPQKTVYCVVCLKYVRSYHECNWKHTPLEDRVAEMWYRRFGKERPNGKNQLMKELFEIKQLVMAEEAAGNSMEIIQN
ncbi:hypothetical protein CAEBREN_06114 [Caenorhabditis brenneri]|uniref:C2H2-type domain-containing protein n=1 Tax=Caenorhabditis brenneri TaxID=135651 RepID=G0M8T8_CAEBE|nr:hypothetical protein CAEBREN_06114 [Caenorhabditis brenneri]